MLLFAIESIALADICLSSEKKILLGLYPLDLTILLPSVALCLFRRKMNNIGYNTKTTLFIAQQHKQLQHLLHLLGMTPPPTQISPEVAAVPAPFVLQFSLFVISSNRVSI